jgi:hypothetical protein
LLASAVGIVTSFWPLNSAVGTSLDYAVI